MELLSNPQLELAYNFLQYTNQNVFLTGKAGTGKTTFLRNLKIKSPKRMVVVAPTGVAAINAGGVTIHSFFQLSFGPQVPRDIILQRRNDNAVTVNNGTEIKRFSREKINIIRSMDLLVIDEISMVRADLLDGIDEVLRRFKDRNKPFGGVQLLMIGDLQQLAPIIKEDEWSILGKFYDTCFFFSSRALKQSKFIGIELKHIFRQSDQHFIDLLNKVRLNQMWGDTLSELNKRYIPGFIPDEKDGYITLTTHNYQSKNINDGKLAQLPSKTCLFKAEINGEFPEYAYPTDAELGLKQGAQVMFVKNDLSGKKLFFNGKIGKITAITDDAMQVLCPGEDHPITVEKLTWQNCRYILNERTQEIEEEVIGTFTQYPLKLAWAITIHKSQGLTFDKAIIDARDSFAHGQVYVALSRCRSLEGMVLSTKISDLSVKNDATVINFTDEVERNQPGLADLEKSRKDYIRELLTDLFDFKPLIRYSHYLLKQWNENAGSLLGSLNTGLKKMIYPVQSEMIDVAEKFGHQINRLIDEAHNPEESPQLQDRIKKAADYFAGKLDMLIIQPFSELTFETDNKLIRKNINELVEKLKSETETKRICLDYCRNGFNISGYLETKSKSMIEVPEKAKTGKSETNIYALAKYPDFYNSIKKWRQDTAELHDSDLRRILPQKTMHGIADNLPATKAELKSIKGMGGTRMQQFGREILEMVIAYRKEKGMELPVNAEKEVMKAGLDSKATSYELFVSGKSVAEIASERGFAVSTIEGHLAHFVANGELELDRLISPEDSEPIIEYIDKHKPESMSDVFDAFNGKYAYSQIRFVTKYLEAKREKV